MWVYCGEPGGCDGRRTGECWLKHQADLVARPEVRARGPAVPWTSGVVEAEAGLGRVLEAHFAAQAARAAPPATSLVDGRAPDLVGEIHQGPRCFFDVEIRGERVGRIVFGLYYGSSPRAAENFRALCTGEKGVAPAGHEGAGKPYHFKGNRFYRIIDRFIDQTGAGTDSVFGGLFKDDAGGLQLKHYRPGLLSMANMGRDTNGSHFSIVVAPAPHLDGAYTIFGEVLEGSEYACTPAAPPGGAGRTDEKPSGRGDGHQPAVPRQAAEHRGDGGGGPHRRRGRAPVVRGRGVGRAETRDCHSDATSLPCPCASRGRSCPSRGSST